MFYKKTMGIIIFLFVFIYLTNTICHAETNFVFPHFTNDEDDYSERSFSIYNNSNYNGNAVISVYENDGDQGNVNISIPSKRMYNKSFSDFIPF